MVRAVFFACVPVALVSAASAQVINGTFDLSVPSNGSGNGWSSIHVDGSGGWRSSGGNPDGMFILNDNGNPATDPTISQVLTGLTVGVQYVVTGDFATIYNGDRTNCF